jgi:hypothetical protein
MKPVKTVVDILQLIRYGSIDPNIVIQWEPLAQMTPKQLAEIRTADAATAANLIDRGVIDATEERERLARDPNSGYEGIDTSKVPSQLEEGEEEGWG